METLAKQSYWESTGKYQKEYDALYKELVPNMGDAETINGELLRVATRLMYEYCNNGNCNACEYRRNDSRCTSCRGDGEDEDGEECVYCDGSGIEVEGNNAFVSPFYQNFLDFIIETVPNSRSAINKVGFIIIADLYSNRAQFSDENMACYNAMVNLVVDFVVSNENKPLLK